MENRELKGIVSHEPARTFTFFFRDALKQIRCDIYGSSLYSQMMMMTMTDYDGGLGKVGRKG